MTVPVNPLTSALAQMQSMAAQAASGASDTSAADVGSGAATAGGFAAALKSSIDKISGDQQKAVGESQAFELGAGNVSLNDVMVDMQKANVGFQFGLQVRNKLVAAYTDIMQIQV
ncbi:Flagellar hook-basal body complex protein FliE [Paraburkholderia caffeinitolerans]|uniref:Flagellar hook-basal body complex protein FliE n=1 Tax=Paraburkholderia caffeinitolerans TaxID=1723730 RepID=A0A6J5FKD2_9BURK|nr:MULTISPECIES: flagellar hook-basal body complex protein FliE [Paraburkholderia]CAB3780310.1 Flagellar hook-basal body complex protein FliE [Paraburkholderia caffeinitolerans]